LHGEGAYKGFGRIELDYNSHQFAGNIAVYGDRHSFNIEVFSFGNLVFKLEEKAGAYRLYYMNREIDVKSGEANFFPLKVQDMKEVVSFFVQTGRNKMESISGVSVMTESAPEGRVLLLSEPGKGNVKIHIDNQI
jgi:hypothetical protein